MSEIKRYDHVVKHPAGGGAFGFMQENVEGGYVEYDDHLRVVRECGRRQQDALSDVTEIVEHIVMRSNVQFENREDIEALKDAVSKAILAERNRCLAIADSEYAEDKAIFEQSGMKDNDAAARAYSGARVAMRIRGEV